MYKVNNKDTRNNSVFGHFSRGAKTRFRLTVKL